MITLTESLVQLPDVPEYLARIAEINKLRLRGGIVPSVQGVYRWARVGVKGVRLEVALINNRMFTSTQALERFFAACAGQPAKKSEPKSRGVSKEEARRLLP